jgi:hypothetical protein
LPVRTSSVPVAREQQPYERSPIDREKERREREKEREYREREKEQPKQVNNPPPTTVATQKKKQEQRISTMTESQIMEKLRTCIEHFSLCTPFEQYLTMLIFRLCGYPW